MATTLLTDLADVQKQARGPGRSCTMLAYLQTRNPEELADIHAVLFDVTVSAMNLWKALSKRDFPSSLSCVRFHRTKGCLACNDFWAKQLQGKKR